MINKLYILVFILLIFCSINNQIYAIKFYNLIEFTKVDAEFKIIKDNTENESVKTFVSSIPSIIIKCDNDFNIIISGKVKKNSFLEETYLESFFNVGQELFFDCVLNKKTNIRIGRQEFIYNSGKLLGINQRDMKLHIFDGIRVRTFSKNKIKYKKSNSWNDLLILTLRYNNGYCDYLDYVYVGGIYQYYKKLGYLYEVDLYVLFKKESNFLRENSPFVITLGHCAKSNIKYKKYKYKYKHEIMYQFTHLPIRSKWQNTIELSYTLENKTEICVKLHTRSRNFKQLFSTNNKLVKYRGTYGFSIITKTPVFSKIINTTDFFIFIKRIPRRVDYYGVEIRTAFNYKISSDINCILILNASNLFKGLKRIMDFGYSFKIVGHFR